MFFALFMLKSLAYRFIVAGNLGKEAPPLPGNGFKELMRRADEIDAAAEKKD